MPYAQVLVFKDSYYVLVKLGTSIGYATYEANYVGFGSSPSENYETTLDAIIINGSNSVTTLRRVKNAISIARYYTSHTILAGDLATEFVIKNGFVAKSLTTEALNVTPDPKAACRPYTPVELDSSSSSYFNLIAPNLAQALYDTISIIALDTNRIIAATLFKVPRRVGDGLIIGSGSYINGNIGEVARDTIVRIVKKYPAVSSVINNKGKHGSTRSRSNKINATKVITIPPVIITRSLRVESELR
ncbi:LOW QUALITY PROTEIN: asparaginase-domain-containing protein [Colletotrichum lupini]|nr:LOW QUALITY PROTEIN: asparaginase-domain-containing protein [Colletotrichum lupini]